MKVGLNQTNYAKGQAIATSQTVTGTFANLGDEINIRGFNKLGIFIDLDINNSTGVVIQVLLLNEPGGDQYTHLISSSYQWTLLDADGNYKLPDFELNGLANYAQLQVKATVLGATAAIIDRCYITEVV